MTRFCLRVLPLLAALAVALPGQGESAPDLAAREAKAGNDAAALFAVAEWAKGQGLTTEWRRLLTRVMAVAPQHEGAHRALGHVQFDGRWMSPAKAEILRQRQEGRVLVNDVWVREEHADDARLGIFHADDGQVVTRVELAALRAGRVRHPRTGELIDGSDLEKARNNLFPDGEGSWVDEAKANQAHKSVSNPWVVRSQHCTLVSTLDLAAIEQNKDYADGAYELASALFGGATPPPTRRPVVILAASAAEFRSFGEQIGGPGSAYGGFLAESPTQIAGVGTRIPAVALMDENWGAYYLKHAVGVAVADGLGRSSLPGWMVTGVGGYTERFYSAEIANWFGKQFLGSGGLLEIGSWFGNFAIHGDMGPEAIGANIYQAGLVLAFCRHGGDATATAAIDSLSEAMRGGDANAISEAAGKVQEVLSTRSNAVRSYLETLTRG